jgi:hypothetical protein
MDKGIESHEIRSIEVLSEKRYQAKIVVGVRLVERRVNKPADVGSDSDGKTYNGEFDPGSG